MIDGNFAKDIYSVKNTQIEQNSTMMGLISIALTLFLGFIGTLISRLVLSKKDVTSSVIATVIHLVFTILAFVPVIGWIIFIIVTIYFTVKNYKLVVKYYESQASAR